MDGLSSGEGLGGSGKDPVTFIASSACNSVGGAPHATVNMGGFAVEPLWKVFLVDYTVH
jgi:hypothetical protein